MRKDSMTIGAAIEFLQKLAKPDVSASVVISVHVIEASPKTFHDIMGLSTRAKNVCLSIQCNNAGDFLNLTPERLRNARNCGDETFREIVEKLATQGLNLKED